MSTVLITGTTSGFGKLFASKFAKCGYDLVLVSRNQEKLNKQKEELKDTKVHLICCDLSKPNASEIILNDLKNNNINIDVLVNNVGYDYTGKFEEVSLAEIDKMINTMVKLTVDLTYGLLPYMLKQNKGMILNVSSVAGIIPLPFSTIYSSTKAFVYMFTNSLAIELKNTNVKVSVLCPGPTKTEFADKANLNESIIFKFNAKNPKPIVDKAYHALNNGRRVIFYGTINKLEVYFYNLLPKKLFDNVLLKIAKPSK